MKLCRYDDDRLGVVRGDRVHDVTDAQTEIRKSLPYDMKGDAVVAALPQWRERIERLADKVPGKPIADMKLLAPVARPTKLSCAPTNYQAHIEEMQKASAQPGSQIVSVQSSKILEAGMFLKANSALVGLFDFPYALLIGLMAVSGFCVGMTYPSRDMLVRAVTPLGAYGRVFGFVSTGFNIGASIAPIVYGMLMDHGQPRWVFLVSAAVSLLCVSTVTIGFGGRKVR